MVLSMAVPVAATAPTDTANSETAIITTSRDDGRFLSSRGLAQGLMKAMPPRLAFTDVMTEDSFPAWQQQMEQAMTTLMALPTTPTVAPPRLVKSVERDGYRVEKWESYPFSWAVVPFLVLIPDGVDATAPAQAAMLCIPGFGQTKELLAGEVGGDYDLEQGGNPEAGHAAMARTYAKEGWVAVAVDNPSCGELMDNGKFDYLNTSRVLLELGWSYLGLSAYQDKLVLDWMKQQPMLDPQRIIVSGFSLGTEPMMALGLMDKDIYAFVYNDFLCTTRERILVMTKPDENGNRPFPNSIEHLIPTFLTLFDFPDIVAALAPRPVICTEGGLDRDFRKISRAYELAGAPEAFEYHHYPRYADPSARQDLETLPEGLNRQEFFNLVNCDSPSHYFKDHLVVPWIHKLLEE